MYEYLDRRYAKALYEVAEEKGKVDKYISDLKEIVHLIENDETIQQVIRHPEITTSKKKSIFTEIFKGKIDNELLSFLLVLIEKNRILYLKEKLKQLEYIDLEKKNILIANVKTFLPLLEDEKEQLKNKLTQVYNKKIIMKEEIDKSIIGGVYVRVGDDVIDGTIKTKLKDMKEIMLKRE
ncbi:F0F1 ATP synthase subunit delta [Clostridium oceanicum]|uniref:ATP synthase subunit delta n=1 Tax=Clostridium oceanicum TaxID=1543 RepID=A0ABP3UX77_9CLOT